MTTLTGHSPFYLTAGSSQLAKKCSRQTSAAGIESNTASSNFLRRSLEELKSQQRQSDSRGKRGESQATVQSNQTVTAGKITRLSFDNYNLLKDKASRLNSAQGVTNSQASALGQATDSTSNLKARPQSVHVAHSISNVSKNLTIDSNDHPSSYGSTGPVNPAPQYSSVTSTKTYLVKATTPSSTAAQNLKSSFSTKYSGGVKNFFDQTNGRPPSSKSPARQGNTLDTQQSNDESSFCISKLGFKPSCDDETDIDRAAVGVEDSRIERGAYESLIQGVQIPNHEATKCSIKKNGIVKGYAANTNQGLVRNYNEDRVAIILNIMKPQTRANETWPKCSFFGVYDGHGGVQCADFLRDNLHQLVIKDPSFPWNPREALRSGFAAAERQFLELAQKNDTLDRSGSCAIVVLIVGDMCYVANVGDSRAVLSSDSGSKAYTLSRDHKPMDEFELKRITDAGGRIYQSQVPQVRSASPGQNSAQQQKVQQIYGPYRVFPGRLSVSRTFGDIEAKLEEYGGNPKVIVAEPEISSFKISSEHDFIALASDGIYDKLSTGECVQSVWESSLDPQELRSRTFHEHCGVGVESIMKAALNRRTLDNITVVLIGFRNFRDRLFPGHAHSSTKKAAQADNSDKKELIRRGPATVSEEKDKKPSYHLSNFVNQNPTLHKIYENIKNNNTVLQPKPSGANQMTSSSNLNNTIAFASTKDVSTIASQSQYGSIKGYVRTSSLKREVIQSYSSSRRDDIENSPDAFDSIKKKANKDKSTSSLAQNYRYDSKGSYASMMRKSDMSQVKAAATKLKTKQNYLMNEAASPQALNASGNGRFRSTGGAGSYEMSYFNDITSKFLNATANLNG